MTRKLSKAVGALVFFTLTLLLSILGMFLMTSMYHPTYAIYAEKLIEKPSNYFVLDKPDRYVLEAISNQHSSIFNSLDSTKIDELTDNHETPNIEYNGSYYGIAMSYGDSFPPFGLPILLLGGIAVSITAIMIISSYKTVDYIKNKK